ncbi:hypothetical protein [Natrononativus amylolyticus]|uniref:hypothetical protein n=1 Tax=Natrononativus amylolyticus TaxID=2963434 RepID=UPI0020CF1996|nr:hypothetical protein [Natrononativus amylolyticus]
MRTARFPSVRTPRTFYDVFGIAVLTVAVLAAIATVRGGALTGVEVAAVLAAVALWTAWAVQRVLERAADDERWSP